jgi:hypothetical protein
LYWLATLILVGGVMAGCTGQAKKAAVELPMAPLHAMHADVQAAPVRVQEAYRFAVANPEPMSEIPCYCGCEPLGHKSNYDCYVAGVDASGTVTFDPHALNCQICVDITHDTRRMLGEGRSLPEVYIFVNTSYSRFGPSNMP